MTSLQAINRSAAGVMINTSLPGGCQSHEQFTVIEKIISRKHLESRSTENNLSKFSSNLPAIV